MHTRHFQPQDSVTERMTRYGVCAVSDSELLSLFLSPNLADGPEQRALSLLQRYGSLTQLCTHLNRSPGAVTGLTARQGAQLIAASEIARRNVEASLRLGDVLSSPEHVRHYLALHLSNLEHEVFSGLFLDNRHRVLHYRELFHGTIDSAAVYPREIVKHCLQCNAAAVIFAHNHPSGVAEPSDTDVRLTRKLVDALALIDVRVLDHLVCGQGVMTSLAERGLM